MATAVEKLLYKIGLIDQMTGPSKKVVKAITNVQKAAAQGARNVAIGLAGMAGAGFAASRLIEPAVQMEKAIGEVASLSVPVEELAKLEKAADKFTLKYGGNATDIVRSAYAIQSAIPGLTDGALAAFTTSSAVLAKATKADAATITSYMGTMYGVFKNQADKMGNVQWVEQLTGQTAAAVRIFKTDGPKMAAAFSKVGNSAALMGASMGEQMAILGKLQTSMEASEAGTKYRAFLNGIGRASQALEIQPLDKQGRLKPTVELLTMIQKQIGHLPPLLQQMKLAKAFGEKEAVAFVQSLSADLGGLRANIAEIDGIPGLGPAEQMAGKMTHIVDRLGAAFTITKRIISSSILNAMRPLLVTMRDVMEQAVNWLQAHPRIAAAIGFTTVGVLALVAAVAAFTAAMGIAQIISAGVAALKIMTQAQWFLNLAMYANPVGLLVAGIVVLIAVLGTAIYAVKRGTGWFKIFGIAALAAMGPVGVIILLLVKYWTQFKTALIVGKEVIAAVFRFLGRTAGGFMLWLIGLVVPVDVLTAVFGRFGATVIQLFGNVRKMGAAAIDWLKSAFLDTFQGLYLYLRDLLEAMARLPVVGKVAKNALAELDRMEINLKSEKIMRVTNQELAPPEREASPAAAPRQLDVPAGGLRQSFNQSTRSTTYGDVYIQSHKSPGPAELEEWMSLQYG